IGSRRTIRQGRSTSTAVLQRHTYAAPGLSFGAQIHLIALLNYPFFCPESLAVSWSSLLSCIPSVVANRQITIPLANKVHRRTNYKGRLSRSTQPNVLDGRGSLMFSFLRLLTSGEELVPQNTSQMLKID